MNPTTNQGPAQLNMRSRMPMPMPQPQQGTIQTNPNAPPVPMNPSGAPPIGAAPASMARGGPATSGLTAQQGTMQQNPNAGAVPMNAGSGPMPNAAAPPVPTSMQNQMNAARNPSNVQPGANPPAGGFRPGARMPMPGSPGAPKRVTTQPAGQF